MTPHNLLSSFFLLFAFQYSHGAAEWEVRPGYRTAPLNRGALGKPGFSELPSATTGISFTNRLEVSRYLTNQIYLNGSGVALGDVDGDGACDIFLCGLGGTSALYRNRGQFKFENFSRQAGLERLGLDATGAALADLDGDKDLDLIINSVAGGTALLWNDGRGHFSPKSAPTLNLPKGGMSLALADIDGDGDLDLYLCNYRTSTLRDHPNTRLQGDRIGGKLVVQKVNGRPTTEPDLVGRFILTDNGKIIENGEVDGLFRNDGKGNFELIPFVSGAFLDEDGLPLSDPPYDWGLSVAFRDLNGDGAPDIYVCNDFDSPDRIWINNGSGNFKAISKLSLRATSRFSMGIDFADINRDGWDDFIVLDMLSRSHSKRQVQVADIGTTLLPVGIIDNRPQYSHNTLFLGRGDGTYAQTAFFSGVARSEWSWTPCFIDVDLDGFEDLLVTTGHEMEMMNADVSQRAEEIKAQKKLSIPEQLALRKMFARLDPPTVAIRNRGDSTFEEVSHRWGFETRGVSHGMALGDLDGDGDLEAVVNNLNGQAGVYRNESGAPLVAVRLKGRSANTRGIGSKIWLHDGAVPVQSQEMMAGGRYLSSDDAMRVFAAGSLTNSMRLEVKWRGGKRQVISGVKANQIYEIEELESEAGPEKLKPPTTPLFEEVSQRLGHRHHEEGFDDFERQPLLPKKLSQLGPGLAWYDLNGDGWDDLVIGSGRGGQLGVFQNNGKGGFTRETNAPFEKIMTRDLATVLGTEFGLLVGSANYEDGLTNGGVLKVFDTRRRVSGESILGQDFSVGAMALADIDGDGTLDLFVGGRVKAGRYPEAVDSLILKNENGRLVIHEVLAKVGMVCGAVFSDLNADGKPDLILASDWGPIRVFHNQGGRFKEATQELGLGSLSGWWNGVSTGDFDGDGRMDIVASNWGLNSPYLATAEHPVKIYYGELEGNGRLALIESFFDPEMKAEVPERGFRPVSAVFPRIREKHSSFEAYGKATLQQIFGDPLTRAKTVQASHLQSMLFLNRGNRFEGKPLPMEAQLSPAFGVSVGDFDGDGHEDIFLGQNFFATKPDGFRNDAGRGLWLKGDGRGGLRAVPGQESGIKVYGEQRGTALCDFDHDGRIDLAVTQNGAETKLFRNAGGRPGLRVRLQGTVGNQAGIGAQMRLVFGEREGAMREIHGGSGYWSQDSVVQVLATPEAPSAISVRWPNGQATRSNIPTGASEIQVKHDGSLTVNR